MLGLPPGRSRGAGAGRPVAGVSHVKRLNCGARELASRLSNQYALMFATWIRCCVQEELGLQSGAIDGLASSCSDVLGIHQKLFHVANGVIPDYAQGPTRPLRPQHASHWSRVVSFAHPMFS